MFVRLQLNGKGGDGGALPARIKGGKKREERKESAAERCERRSGREFRADSTEVNVFLKVRVVTQCVSCMCRENVGLVVII